MRITRKALDPLCNRLASLLGVEHVSGNHASMNGLYISSAYGGFSLRCMLASGGEADVFHSGHIPARDLYERISAAIYALELKRHLEAHA